MEKSEVKMRVKLLNPDFTIKKDRLISQDSEFNLGAPEKHKGPITLEVTLRDKADVAQITKYLGQLLGDLPITERKVYGKKEKVEVLDKEPIKDMLDEMTKTCKTQDDVVKYLRDRNFKFVTAQFLEDRQMGIQLVEEHKNDYQFMIRLLKETQNPLTDKYDPQLVVGIKFAGKEKGKYVRVYLYNKFESSLKLPWAAKSDINFKKIAFMKFPHYMVQEERDKYSLEMRKMKLNPELKPTKFMLRWKPVVDDFNKS